MSPLNMPTRKVIQPRTRRLAWTTKTGDRPLGQSTRMALDCPGCNGEVSKSVGVMLGCTICPL